MKCFLCLQEGDNKTLYKFYRNKNFVNTCFDEDECQKRREQLKDEDFYDFFKERFGCNFYDLQPIKSLKNELYYDNNEYYYDHKTKKYFVHYDAYDNFKMEDKIKKTLKDYLSYPINEIKNIPKEYLVQ